MSIEIGLTEPQPLEVTFEEIHAGVEVSVDSNPVIIEFPTPPEIQVAVNEVYQTNGGGGSGKSPYIGGNGNWFYYNDVTQQYIDSGVKAQGNPGKTAYQSAVDGGYTNTEPQFNTDLSQVSNKVDKVAGKGLSTNDFTNTLKDKLDSTEVFTLAEKTQGALATGNISYPTVKDVADRVNTLLINFVVPTDTPSIEFLYTDTGVLLSTLNLKRVILSGKFITDIAVAAGSERLSINGDNTNTYASSVSASVVGGYRFPIYKLTAFDAILSITNNTCVLSGSIHASQNTVITNTNTLSNVSLSGVKDGATTINSIKIERANNIFVFKAGSTIKIYRND